MKSMAVMVFCSVLGGGAFGVLDRNALGVVRVSVKDFAGVEHAWGGPIGAGQPVPVVVQDVETTYSNFQFIRVESDADAIGPIALSGNGGVGHDVRLLVAKPALAEFPTWDTLRPFDPLMDNPAYVAGASLAGVSTDQGSTNVILVGLIEGDITGPVTVGEVYTLRSRSGRITAPVTATKSESNDWFGDRTDDAIKHIFAGDGITGTISATGSRGTIARIVVGPKIVGGVDVAYGIDGDIVAEGLQTIDTGGLIDSIESTGPIGVTHRVNIRAGWGVWNLTCRTPDGSGGFLPRTVDADINAATDPQAFVVSPFDMHVGAIYLWRVSGDFTGHVVARFVKAPTYPFGEANQGIFVSGTITNEVEVRTGVLGATIQAGTFLGGVKIGHFLKGAVIATQGSIPYVRVGRNPDPDYANASWQSGFIGSACPPPWHQGSCEFPGGEPQSVIRAHDWINEIDLFQMTTSFYPGLDKYYPPRIECPFIHTVKIGNMDPSAEPELDGIRQGLIWSGLTASPLTSPTPTANYADIKDFRASWLLGVAAPRHAEDETYLNETQVFVRDVGSRFDVFHGSPGNAPTGNIYFKSIGPGSVVRFGCDLTVTNLGSDAEVGRVRIADPQGLNGQILLDTKAGLGNSCEGWQPGYLWGGPVDIGMQAGSPVVRLPVGGILDYALASNDLGGGAIGVVPYHVYPTDYRDPPGQPARPGDGTSGNPKLVLQSEVSGQIGYHDERAVLVPFYGPLVPGSSLARVEMLINPQTEEWLDVSTKFFRVVAGAPGVDARRLLVGARAVGFPSRNVAVPVGRFRVVQDALTPEAKKVRCAGTFATGVPVPVADFAFYFCVVPDCDQDGWIDAGTNSCGDFVACSSGGVNCIADCDNGSMAGTPDGGVDINDLLYYLAIYEAGTDNADVDDGSFTGTPDFAVDISDFLYYLSRYEAGC